jgi:hypothetical protein
MRVVKLCILFVAMLSYADAGSLLRGVPGDRVQLRERSTMPGTRQCGLLTWAKFLDMVKACERSCRSGAYKQKRGQFAPA